MKGRQHKGRHHDHRGTESHEIIMFIQTIQAEQGQKPQQHQLYIHTLISFEKDTSIITQGDKGFKRVQRPLGAKGRGPRRGLCKRVVEKDS